jgi:hypothetical protein
LEAPTEIPRDGAPLPAASATATGHSESALAQVVAVCGTSAAPTTPCVVCREPMQYGAEKCTKCDSYQDWSRYLTRWSAALTSVLALAPLSAIAVALYSLAATPQPDLRFAALACTQETVTVAVTNLGKAAGIVNGPTFRMIDGGQQTSGAIELSTREPQMIVKPGEARIANYTGAIRGAPASLPAAGSLGACRYEIGFGVLAFPSGNSFFSTAATGGTSSSLRTVSCECPR